MVEVTEVESKKIMDSSRVTVTRMGHIVEVQHMDKRNTSCHIKKIDKNRYVLLETGEIKDFDLSENRLQNVNSLRQTFKTMRYAINNNYFGLPNELFVTLTLRGELQTSDHLLIGKYYDNFMKSVKRAYGSVDAVKVLEPHASGKYHLHVLLRFNDYDTIYIPNSVNVLTGDSVDAPMRDMWGKGNITIKSLKNVDNIGAYVSGYLSDIEIPDGRKVSSEVDVVEKEVEGKTKRFIKGGRLAFYPSGVNIYSKTRGIVPPEREEMTYKEAKKIVGLGEPHYKKSIEINDAEKDFNNTITYEEYNLRR